MSLKVVPLDSNNEKQHRTVIATATNELIKVRPPHDATEAEAAAGVRPIDTRFPPGHVARYGAKGDDTRNDLKAIQDAFAQFEQAGGWPVQFERGKTYWCGEQDSSPTLFSVDDVIGGSIYGNGAKIRIETTDLGAPIGLQFNDCKHIEVHGLRFQDDGASQADASGVVAFDVRASGATDEDIGHIYLHDCELDKGVMFLRVAGDATGETSTNQANRIRNVNVIRGRCRETFYVFNLQNHGDDCHIDIHAENIHRAVFFYGVTGLRTNVYVKNPRGGFAIMLCKAYDRSTENARVHLYVESSASGYEFLLFEFENDTQDESIRDIEVNLNCRNGVGTLTPVTFRAFNAGHTVTRTTTDNRWDNIRLTGDWSGFSTPIVFTTRPTTEGRLVLSPSLSNNPRLNHSGFVLLVDAFTEVRCVNADLTANSVTIPCARYDGNAFHLKVTVYAQDVISSVATAAQTVSHDSILAYNQSGGNVAITEVVNLYYHNKDTASAITYAASGENITVSFTNYNNANAFARVVTEHTRGYAS